jgi:hypothetical protein
LPNWCAGELNVYGEKEEVQRFKDFAKDDKDGRLKELDAEKFLPYPYREKQRKIEKIDEKYQVFKGESMFWKMNKHQAKYWDFLFPYPEKKINEIMDGEYISEYDFHRKEWGSKWNFNDVYLEENEEGDELHYLFDSAWGPMDGVVEKMGEMFPKLTFEYSYYESGMNFRGYMECAHGKIIESRCWDMQEEDYEELELGIY